MRVSGAAAPTGVPEATDAPQSTVEVTTAAVPYDQGSHMLYVTKSMIYKQTKNRNETGSNLSLGTRLTVLSKRLGRKRCCDATPDRCLGGVPSHYLRFAL